MAAGTTRRPATRPQVPAPSRHLPPGPAESADDEELPQGLTLNYWFDSGSGAQPYVARLRFAGRRTGVDRPSGRDTFVREETVAVVPHSGPVSVSPRVFDINAGEWEVAAEMLSPNGGRPMAGRPRAGAPAVHPAAWSWPRWKLLIRAPAPLKTRLAPLTGFDAMPAVIPGSWVLLVALGVVVGFLFQGRLLPYEHVAPGRVFPVSLLMVAAGIIGAKLWFIALKRTLRGVWRDGMCIQGSLVGAAVVGLAAMALLHLPIGAVVDATTPGLFIGIAVGRTGCFLTGCCAGRATSSRWALWSSDRRVGARRIPVQLLESLSGLVIGAIALVVVLHSGAGSGALFLASFAAYTLCRQGLLRLRAERRRSSIGGPLSAALAATVLAASTALLIIGVR
ncbi:MAG: prolipoprotein diacylglyceryl transferase [Candidatus Dormibacteraeota bacterium]|uniref:Prolipoprotein diacylglyceryl transferase n=1 Tax=Candidatus Amunia macphersoniae TaxID=3127014 RepID=A0A934KQE5_9BACT|nr:prolipoprotein diacylglyceryl transferase [Candidatus Dormibacteraeota bacterium]